MNGGGGEERGGERGGGRGIGRGGGRGKRRRREIKRKGRRRKGRKKTGRRRTSGHFVALSYLYQHSHLDGVKYPWLGWGHCFYWVITESGNLFRMVRGVVGT